METPDEQLRRNLIDLTRKFRSIRNDNHFSLFEVGIPEDQLRYILDGPVVQTSDEEKP